MSNTPHKPNQSSIPPNPSDEFCSRGEQITWSQDPTDVSSTMTDSIRAFQSVLPERYQIVREIGQGGMGQVLLAIDRGPNLKKKDYVAIKRMLGSVLGDSKAVDKFLEEVTLARTLRHPNVVKMFHSENTPLGPYIVMEYIDGIDLGEYIQRYGPLSEGQALACFRKLAAALDEGHRQGIIHRDLKPRNILISNSGQAFLVDFGIARRLSDDDKTGTGMGAGTLAYMSPEQLENRKPDAKQDIYSLGATLFHAVEGHPPFQADNMPRLIAKIIADPAPKATKVSAQLAERITQCLAKEPHLRPANCQAVCKLAVSKDSTPPVQEKTTSELRMPTASVDVPPVSKSPQTFSPISTPESRAAPARGDGARVAVGLIAFIAGLFVWSVTSAIWQPWSGVKPHDIGKIAQDAGRTPEVAVPPSDVANKAENSAAADSETPRPGIPVAEPTEAVPSNLSASTAAVSSLPQSLTNSIDMEFRLIQPGTFTMGSPTSEVGRLSKETQHEVTLSRPYYLGVYEVTQEQYEKVMGTNPSSFKGTRHPVEMVSWEDAKEFIAKLNSLSAEQSAGREYRLPTEAEWEHACRAGSKAGYSFGDDASALGKYGWFADNSGSKTHPVGEKQPNSWGLHDMHGNVYEWCEDWYGSYPAGAVIDPTGPSVDFRRVSRGGSWYSGAAYCRSASRNWLIPSDGDYGFRLALSPAGIPQ
ncbi:MAG: SUMF1/EgtB/PvdO family nonheme iron enzyme [Planctomycetaceae bacterium]|nr:SUMF1/EgtB/PvdO family nonheme iron enzyme [Planctomycetaceae bacterium]